VVTVITIMTAAVADALTAPRCDATPDVDGRCLRPALYRITLQPIPGFDPPVTFACAEHGAWTRTWPTLATIRSLRP
jgi:hypothetical protein